MFPVILLMIAVFILMFFHALAILRAAIKKCLPLENRAGLWVLVSTIIAVTALEIVFLIPIYAFVAL